MNTICQDKQTKVFLNWFTNNGGTIHSAVEIAEFPAMGRGAVAIEDIKKDTVLFTLPRSLTLSLRTSSLPMKFGLKAWRKHRLHKGWAGLILCMMWEDTNGEAGKWFGYLQSLPSKFTTPMMWALDDLAELEGTSIFDKIGRKSAEDDYYQTLLPAMKTRPDLFDPEKLDILYSIEQYHTMGSRILSRCFHVEMFDEDEDADEGAACDVGLTTQSDDDNDTDDDSDDDEDSADVAMVPMADILNARYKSENAKLCYELKDLEMISTKDIKKGEQIVIVFPLSLSSALLQCQFNTYGDPPNSDLLRRYGHVDIFPLKDGMIGNPADVVEIRLDIVVDVLKELKTEEKVFARIDWWLDRGDDVYNYEMEGDIPKPPEELISFIRLLTMPEDEWLKTREKGKIPKPKFVPKVANILIRALELRLKQYKTTLNEDKTLLQTDLSQNKRMAVIIRMGEKRILESAIRELSEYIPVPQSDPPGPQKRVSPSHSSKERFSKSRKVK
ncbi:hypothetical protein Clacol_000502 [Clathrus columnatus]|uniref:SET domain-containing protein n=1 Tax=Clathrus columnatus TaxID=1419009 RepID=A0AAV4ZZW1_9AGAM|nr:hypothetical protein Clacol_000502 [Clathrus columnatus]